MPAEIGAPKQHKQPSRKGKRAWRKNVDITQVQDGLEALREEIIQTGSGPISEQKSEDLFALDTLGSEDIKKRTRSTKPLKVDEILARRSAVPAIDSRKRSGALVTDGIVEPASKRQKKDWVSKKEVQRLKQVANTNSHLTGDEAHAAATFDLWAMPSEPTPDTTTSTTAIQALEYVPNTRVKVAPSSIRQPATAMTASGKPIKSIGNPNAGTSYNPDFEQWDDLLTREGAKALEQEQTRLIKEAAAAEKQARVDALAAQNDDNDPAYRTDDESAWEGFGTDREGSDAEGVLRQKRPQRKTPAQRNKIKRRKEAERLAKHTAKMAAGNYKATVPTQDSDSDETSTTTTTKTPNDLALTNRNSTSNSNSALAKVEAEAEVELGQEIEIESEEEEKEETDAPLRRRRLGNTLIPQSSLELVLPDELRDSLRQLRPEGNLLSDRFRTLLVNGKIESRRPVVKEARKKRKVKVSEKWGYKDFEIRV